MTSNLNSVLSARFRAVLANQHLSIVDFARMTNQAYASAKRRVNGEVPITIDDLETFCAVTGYTPAEYLADEFVLKQSPSPAREVA